MSAPYSIPTTIDSVVLATSLADYRDTMVDNVYQNNALLQMLSEKKELIGGLLTKINLETTLSLCCNDNDEL